MHLAYLITASVTITINAAIAAADYVRAPFVLANSAEVEVPERWLPWLATCKLAGAAGLLIGVAAGSPPLAVAAALGLTLFYIGAIWFHVRAKVVHNIAFPGFYLATATATLALACVA